jgi:transposase
LTRPELISSVHFKTVRWNRTAGANFRRLKARLGAPKAITAMANKLAKLVYRLLVYGKDYFDRGAQIYEHKFRLQRIRRLQKQAKMLNLKLVPA